MARETGRPVYVVEKFVPRECPKCRRRFQVPNRDFVLFLGDIVEGKRVPRIVDALHDLIVCRGCRNVTARVKIETQRVWSRAEAQSLRDDLGFTAIWCGLAFGVGAEVAEDTVYPLGLGLTLPGPTLSVVRPRHLKLVD